MAAERPALPAISPEMTKVVVASGAKELLRAIAKVEKTATFDERLASSIGMATTGRAANNTGVLLDLEKGDKRMKGVTA